MICAACTEPLGHPWEQCNATPDVSYHRDCCPSCAAPLVAHVDRPHPHGATGYYNYACRCDFCKGAASVVNARRYDRNPAQRNLRHGVRT